MYASNKALSAFTGYTRADIVILYRISQLSQPASYTILQQYAHADGAQKSIQGFCDSIDRLVSNKEVNKNQIGLRTSYTITAKGINTLQRFNTIADQIVKEMICKYADENNL